MNIILIKIIKVLLIYSYLSFKYKTFILYLRTIKQNFKTKIMNKEESIKKVEILEQELKSLKKIINEPKKITDIIHSFEDAVEYTNFQIPLYWQFLPKDTLAYEKIKLVISVLNEGWIADFNNKNEPKYFIYWNMGSSGVGFSYYDFSHWSASSGVGGSLCLKTDELCEHIGNSPKLIELFKGFMTYRTK